MADTNLNAPPTIKKKPGEDGVYGSPVADAGEEFRATEVPQRPGPTGTGRQADPDRHPGQNLVPEPKVTRPDSTGSD